MIARLTGTLASKTTESIIIDVGGVGYELLTPLSALEALPPEGEDAMVHVYTHVREDQITLFGFVDAMSRKVFVRLIGISGVGPKVALSILSTLTTQELYEAGHSGNIKPLTRVPGIGPKKAKRLVLELKDALGKIAPDAIKLAHAGSSGGGSASIPSGGFAAPVWDELRSALGNLGYPEAAVNDYVGAIQRAHPEETNISKLIRYALDHIRG